MPQMTDAYDWRGRTLVGSDGERIGTAEEVYVDAEGGHPEWARVAIGTLRSASAFVPLVRARPQGEDVLVQVTKSQVEEAPRPEPEDQLSQEQEMALYRHYGIEFTEEGSVTARDDESIGAQGIGHVLGERAGDDSATPHGSSRGEGFDG